MKQNLLSKTILGLSIIAGAIAINLKSSYGQDRFACGETRTATVFYSERGTIPIIRYVDRSFPPPYTPEQRCQIVSNRFKKFDNNGTLKYIKASQMNNLPVLCVAAYKGGSCLPDGLLVTFKPGTDANQALIKLLDRRVWGPPGPIKTCRGCDNSKLISEVNGETYFDLELFIQQLNTDRP
ncbi:MAG: COP23 domain-containing protein [Pleurocapsa sp. MO_226.B13]|nr:COP23 domain-containing protein [Pleurocapsa sp. MO_226.B13]